MIWVVWDKAAGGYWGSTPQIVVCRGRYSLPRIRCGVRARHVRPEKEGEMGEFTSTIESRLDQAYKGLEEARSSGDAFLADALTAEIEDLRRLADDHGILIQR
ncbi:hypothetical protein GCM10023194_22630 [Planotetraspora phitsanulokensis]|uniref:Uncharacterized protein n=2 Tax=Planotetraspora TaxID=58120 RepID=A0A8J3U4Z7_9ACTN|nr:hypothetical protein Pph01_33230 [Planotetraspora phitsanulokensis]